MKFLALLLALLFIGCDDGTDRMEPVSQGTLQYKAADLVLVHEPFYENCFGFVVDYVEMRQSGKPQLYKVAMACRATGPLGKIVTVPETDLQLRVRSELQVETQEEQMQKQLQQQQEEEEQQRQLEQQQRQQQEDQQTKEQGQ